MIIKSFNIIKLILSYLLSNLLKKPIHWGMPYGISIEPTNKCNLSCPQCPTGMKILTRAEGKMNVEIIKILVADLSPFLYTSIFYFQGEPFINHDIYDVIKFAHDKSIYGITSTNGHFVNEFNANKIIESGLRKLIISIDGTSQEVYDQYRVNGSLSKVIEGAKILVNAKKRLKSKKPKIVFQFLVTAKNEHQIEDAKRLAKELMVDKIEFKTTQIYDFKFGNALIPKNEKYSRYKKNNDGTYKIKSNQKNHCWRMWTNPVVTVSGDVVPCCFDKDAKYKMGNLNNQSFKEIWKSEAYKNYRAQVLKNRKSIDICTNCTEGLFKVHL